MENKILKILKDTFELENVDKTLSQDTCEAWDSMGQLNLVLELESEFGVSFEPEEILQMKSFDDILRIVTSKV